MLYDNRLSFKTAKVEKLYTPVEGLGNLSAASPGELLLIDYWADPGGMETFFSNPFVQEAASGFAAW